MRPTSVATHDEARGHLVEAATFDDPYLVVLACTRGADEEDEALAQWVRSNGTLPPVHLVRIVPLASQSPATNPSATAFDHGITRPVRTDTLHKALMALISPDSAPSEPAPPPSTKRPERSRVRILVAEDNRINQQVAVCILASLGYERVDVAANGREAISCLEQVPYDMVLMDCEMPEMDGFEATAVIRDPASSVCNHQVPVIALTAHSVQGDRERCLQAGMDDYLEKPVKPDALASVVERWSSGLSNDDEAPESDAPSTPSSAPEEPPVLDRTSVGERVGNDPELARTLSASFVQELPDRLGDLTSALTTRDLDRVLSNAQALRVAAADLGALRIATTLEAAEKAAQEGDLARILDLLPALHDHARLTKAALGEAPR